MGAFTAMVTRGPGKANIAICPTQGTPLRAIEKVLSDARMSAHATRGKGLFYMPFADFLKLQKSFNEWGLELSSEVKAEVESAEAREKNILRSQQVLATLTQSSAAEIALSDFPMRIHLDPHQLQAVAVATHPEVNGLCLFDEQGLGKTVTTLFAYDRLRQLGSVTKLLVIAPKNVVFEWVRDAERFYKEEYKIQAVIGSKLQKRQDLNVPADIYVTNFETVVTLQSRLRDFLEIERGQALLVVDESFFVKNPGALRTRALKELRKLVQRCLVLCGTPAPNSPHDIVEQFNIADGGATFKGVSLPKERNEAAVVARQIIRQRGVYLRRLKQDVMPELPGKTFHRILVPLQPEQEKAYIATLRNLIVDLNEVDDVAFNRQITSFMARRFALLQLCSAPSSVLSSYREVSAKILALDSILDELIATRKEKVVLWSFFTASLREIVERYSKYNPVLLDGTVTDMTTRRDAVRKFQEDEETMLFVANPAAAGAGLTLHKARYAIYVSMPVQPAHYFQSLDRIHRRGQMRPVEYVILLCDRTIEVQEYDRLMVKERESQRLLRDRITAPLTRSSMLVEAIDAAQLIGIDPSQR